MARAGGLGQRDPQHSFSTGWTLDCRHVKSKRRSNQLFSNFHTTVLLSIYLCDFTYSRPLQFLYSLSVHKAYQPCSYGEKVPASILMYGSILIDVTLRPPAWSIVPMLLAMIPLPTPLITPPVTRMYFILRTTITTWKTHTSCVS